jgi:hypothetical protein
MSISTSYKKVGSTIKETSITKPITKPKGGMILNANMANEKIVAMEKQLGVEPSKPTFDLFKTNERVAELEKQLDNNSDKEVTVKEAIDAAGFTSKEQAIKTIEATYNKNLITRIEKNEAINIVNSDKALNAKPNYKFDYNSFKTKDAAKKELSDRYFKIGSPITNAEYNSIKAEIDNSDLPQTYTAADQYLVDRFPDYNPNGDNRTKYQIEDDTKAELETKQKELLALVKQPKYNGNGGQTDDPKLNISLKDLSQGEDVLRAKMALIDAQENYRIAQVNTAKPSAAEVARMCYENNERTSKCEVFYFAKQGYYLCYDVVGQFARTYIHLESDKHSPYFHYLIHRIDGHKGSANCVVASTNSKAEDLTKAEFLSIIMAKPSYEEICATYNLHQNIKVTINIDVVTPIYG